MEKGTDSKGKSKMKGDVGIPKAGPVGEQHWKEKAKPEEAKEN